MKRVTRSLLVTAGATLLSAIFYFYTVANRDGIVIRHHYSGWRTLSTVGTVLLIATGSVFVLNLAFLAYKAMQNRRELRSEEKLAKQREAEINESKKLRNPEDVRTFFIRICNERPHCQIAKMIKSQLDEMNECQSRFNNLREINDISMAQNIETLLQDIENGICANCKVAINKYIVGDESGFEETAKRVHKKNGEILEKVKSFLTGLTNYASGSQSDGDDAVRNLTVYEETIRESMNEEVF